MRPSQEPHRSSRLFTDPGFLQAQIQSSFTVGSSTREPPRSPPADTVEPPPACGRDAPETAEPSRGPFQ
eukprot:2700735-Karenia_brevis.AAC.1